MLRRATCRDLDAAAEKTLPPARGRVSQSPHRRASLGVVEPQYLKANGVDFAYLEKGDGPLVILIHGFPDTADSWLPTMDVLADAGFRAVAPWTRGYHPTAIPTDAKYDGDTLGRDVLGWIDALGGEPAIVVGHDWGASAAYAAAGLSPEAFRQLITVAIPHPAAVKPTPKLAWAVRHFVKLALPGAAQRMRDSDFTYVDELVRRWSPTWNPGPEETRAVKEAFGHPGCAEAAVGYYKALYGPLPKGHRKRVTVDAVAFCGRDDIMKRANYDRAARRYVASYDIIEMPGGHFMHREHPDAFHRELLRVIKR